MTEDGTIWFHKGGSMYDDRTHIEPEGWYFVDETFANYYGPYPTREAADEAQTEYARHL